MNVADLIAPTAILVEVRASEKMKLLEGLAARAAAMAELDPTAVVEGLRRREELGSTGMGGGVAIPHARLPGVTQPMALFARLKSPIEWDAIDGRPVDLVCLLLLPSAGRGSEPLAPLACVARQLRHAEQLDRLRRAPDEAALYALLTAPPTA